MIFSPVRKKKKNHKNQTKDPGLVSLKKRKTERGKSLNMQQVAAEGKGMLVVSAPQSGTAGRGLKLERGTRWEKVPCPGVAPSSKIPAFFEVASLCF